MKCFLLFVLLLVLMIVEVYVEFFIVFDIWVNGLQCVFVGSVFVVLLLNVGEIIDDQVLVQVICFLFKIGFFQDIQFGCDGNVLVVIVVECLLIFSIEIEGNKVIFKEDLFKGLKQFGLVEGEIFQCVIFEGVCNEL